MMRVRKLNKKGFTMVELLAVIVILGILAIISVAAVQGIIAKAKERYYKSQEENFVMAAQSYLNNNKKKQPKVSGQTVKVYLKDLRTAKYIDPIVDYKKEECNANNSYVQVFKYEDDVYYTPYITCPNYTTDLKAYTSDIEISTTFTGDDKNLNKAGANIKIEDKNARTTGGAAADVPHGIVSYQYKIYQEGKLKYTSDYFDEKKVSEVNKTVSLVSYTPGMIKIAVTATNIYGNSVTKTFTKSYRDQTPPSCGAITGASTTWKEGTRVVSVACDDAHGSGCKQALFTYEFTGDVQVGNIKIEDNSGNSANCPVNVYIDNNPPVLELKVYKKKAGVEEKADDNVVNTIKTSNSNQTVTLTVDKDNVNGWLNAEKYPNGVYLEVGYNDISSTSSIEWKWNDSKQKKSVSSLLRSIRKFSPTSKKGNTKSSLVDEGYRQGQVIATDQFGHTSIININIPMDRTPPAYLKFGDSTKWTKDDRSVTVTCIDDLSECASNPGTKVYNTTTKTQQYVLKDKAGNTTTFNANIYVDKTAPNCNKVTGASTTWTGANRTIKVGCSDNHSGCSQADFSKVFDDSTKVGKITISDKVGNTRDCDVNAYVDKTPPTCGNISGASTTWTNRDRNISVACSDSQSGCTNNSFSNNFTSTQQTGNITIKDNVGNTAVCPVNVYIDKNKPTCGAVSGDSTTWTKSDRNITVACNDTGGSGCNAVSKNFNSTTKTANITLKDGAGNSVSCAVNAYVDKTAPSCGTVSGDSTSWTKNDRKVKIGCSDSESGCSNGTFENNFNYSTKTGNITISDNVGNTRNCGVNVYVDKTAPSCGNISGQSTTWTKNDREISVACSDSHSGCTDTSFKRKFNWTLSNGTITIKDKAGNTRDCGVNAYVDKTAPTCGWKEGESSSWTNGDRQITVHCNDSGSGCSAVTKKYTSTKRTDTIQIKDGAGNTANCGVNVFVDKTAPSCNGVWGDSTSWTNGDRSIGVGCSDSDSGCGQGSYSRYFNWTVATDGITIWDHAGNSRWCGVNVYVDKTPPNVWTSYGPVGQSCGGRVGVLASYEVREWESGLAFVGDWWGWDWDFDGSNALNRNVGWGSTSFSKTHHWSSNCTSVRAPAKGICYRIKVLARDIAGNETHHVSPDCAYRG